MKWKRTDAWNALRLERYNNTRVWRMNRPILEHENVINQFNCAWETEKNMCKDLLQEKRRRKVNFLWQKYEAREEECITEIAGVNVEDQEIPESFTSSPRCYGGVGLSENEEKILSLPPKFAVYGKVIVTACEAQVEKGLAKLRWTVKREERNKQQQEQKQERQQRQPQWQQQQQQQEDKEEIFDPETLDLRWLKPTDLPFNKRVFLPEPLSNEREVAIQHLRDKLSRVTEEYVRATGSTLRAQSNLTEAEKAGLKILKGRIRQGEFVVYQTNKSGRFSIDTVDNYRNACRPHVESDLAVPEDLYKDFQRKVNAHSSFWVRILKAGENVGGKKRIKNNLLVQDCAPAPVNALIKKRSF
jgi:hypothetical protein